MLVASANSRLLRFLLSLVARLRLSAGRVALAVRAGFSLFWRSILAIAHRRGQSRIQLHASNVPVAGNNSIGQLFEHRYVGEHDKASLATTPMGLVDRWREEIERQRALPSSHQFELSKLQPTTPEGGSQRYKPNTGNLYKDSQRTIPVGQQTLLSSLSPPVDGWRRRVHPEGVVLFYHERLRISTENDMSDPAKEGEILFFAAKLVEIAMQTGSITLDGLTEIVVNVDENRRCRYHFVDHTHRLLFWVHGVDVTCLYISPGKNSGYNHIRYMVESHYWYVILSSLLGMSVYLPRSILALTSSSRLKHICDIEYRLHCEYYPHNCTLSKDVFEDIRGTLNYAKIDTITTDASSSPFGQDEIVAMLDFVNSLKGDKISDPYSIWAIARLMADFTENRFLNFHGQPCARLDADTSFEKQNWNHHFLFRAINLFLLGSPSEHALRLHRVWVDGIIIQPRWKDFISRLTTELGRYTIFSTVMLTVNFSFLAVPGVTTPGAAVGPIQIIIYCSVVSTVASIVFSFGLLNVYSNPRLLIARNALDAMSTLDHGKTGIPWLAITHSLPLASLIWSIALFTAALAVQIFDTKERAIVATLTIEFAIIVSFAAMGVRVMRLFSQDDSGDDADAPTEKKLSSTVPGREQPVVVGNDVP